MKLPATIDEKLAALRSEIRECRSLRGAAVLRQLEGDKTAAKEIEDLEIEIAGHERAIASLEDAKVAAGAQITEEGIASRRKAVKAAQTAVSRLDAEIDGVAEKMLGHLEAIAPLAAQFEAACGERRNVMWSGFRAGVGSANAMRRFENVDNFHSERSVAAMLQNALFNSGLGRGRLTMSNTHVDRGVVYTLEDMRAALAKAREKVRYALEASRRAIDPEESAQ